ncbi:hypothetical protein VTO42DRAFT_5713 [Malbranchea cinnamomea]
MELMRNWLIPLVERAIRSSLEPRGEHADSLASRKDSISPAIDDGSNFRIPVRSRKCAQIVKWSNSESTVEGTLSDSHTTIDCSFSRESVRRYEAEFHKKIRQDTKGAILKLLQFEIVVSHLTDVTLYIVDFELQGCEGTGVFGNPQKIRRSRIIFELARRLCEAHKKQSVANGEDDDDDGADDSDDISEMSSVQSQPLADAGDAQSTRRNCPQPASQEVCLTQLPSDQVMVPPNSVPELTVNPESRSNAKELLKNLTVATRATDTNSLPNGSNLHPEKGHISSNSGKTPIPRRRNTTPTNKDDSTHGIAKQTKSQTPIADTHLSRTSLESQRDASILEESMPSYRSRARVNPNKCDQNTGSMATNNVWTNMKRIRRRDIMIPKDQEELIESPDSWFPPEPGKQLPQAHVPVDLLRQWNDMATRRVNSKASSPDRLVQPDEQELESHKISSSSSSEWHVGEDEWGPSPSQKSTIVPPDSSPITPLHGARPDLTAKRQTVSKPTRAVDDEDNTGIATQNTHSIADLPNIALDDDFDSEMETAVPIGLGTVASQENSTPANGSSHAAPLQSSSEETHSSESRNSLGLKLAEIEVPRSDPEVAGTSDAAEESHPASSAATTKKRKREEPGSERFEKLQKISSPTSTPAKDMNFVDLPAWVEGRISIGPESRLAYFAGETTLSPGQRVYESFKQAYPEYEGDIVTFKKACRLLQSLSTQGELRRTLLWDDFILRETEEYQSYMLECFHHQRTPVSYKTYFLDNVTSARFKKRNLSAKRVAMVVEDNEIDDRVDPDSQSSKADNPVSASSQSVDAAQPVPALVIGVDDSNHTASFHQLTDTSQPALDSLNEANCQQPSSRIAGNPDKGPEMPEVQQKEISSEDSQSEDTEWHECNETHEVASVDLGDDSKMVPDNKEGENPKGEDVEMDDRSSVSSGSTEARAAPSLTDHDDSAMNKSYSLSGVTEIEESDVEISASPGPDVFSLHGHSALKPTNDSTIERETPIHNKETDEKQTSPEREQAPHPPSHSTSAFEQAVLSEPKPPRRKRKPWWKHPNTPFKAFAQAYAGLKSELARLNRAYGAEGNEGLKLK